MSEEKEHDFEIVDTEEYRAEDNQEFSHQSLIMIAMRKVIEYACGELIPGYYNTEEDNKGKTKIVYKQDTRKAFIESVRTLRMIMICDFDGDAKKKLIVSTPNDKGEILYNKDNLMDRIVLRKMHYLNEQKKWWNGLSEGQKRELESKGLGIIPGYFNTEHCFYQQYFLEEIDIYREIFEELTLLTERKGFYKAEHYEG